MKTFNCIHCGAENKWGHSKVNKYCGPTCKAQYEWEHLTKPRIERGECTHNSGAVLKKFLIETKGEHCEECGQTGTWNNKPLVLQLDHVDGDSDNNYPKNLRLLCPNCHSQSENFGSKGKGSRYKKITKRNQYLREYKK
jgi:Zn finger protein HypA/HybF involved in hydrogenase expression